MFIFFVVVAAASGVVFVVAGLAPMVGWVRQKLAAQTSSKPAAQVGIRLEAPSDLAEMVNITGRSEQPGETRGREASGYFIGDRKGKSTEDAAATMVEDMLLHALKTTDVAPATPETAKGPSGQ